MEPLLLCSPFANLSGVLSAAPVGVAIDLFPVVRVCLFAVVNQSGESGQLIAAY